MIWMLGSNSCSPLETKSTGERDMADDIQKLTKDLEKLCTECAADVGKIISNCRNTVSSRMGQLADDIEKLQVPTTGDLPKVSDIVTGALKRGGSRYASVATFGVRV